MSRRRSWQCLQQSRRGRENHVIIFRFLFCRGRVVSSCIFFCTSYRLLFSIINIRHVFSKKIIYLKALSQARKFELTSTIKMSTGLDRIHFPSPPPTAVPTFPLPIFSTSPRLRCPRIDECVAKGWKPEGRLPKFRVVWGRRLKWCAVLVSMSGVVFYRPVFLINLLNTFLVALYLGFLLF